MKKDEKIKNINEYKKKDKNNYKNRRNKKGKNKFLIAVVGIVIIGGFIGNIYVGSIVSELKYEIYYLKKDLRDKEVSLEQVEAEVVKKTSVQELEKKAKEELDMDYPKESQIEYIEVED